MATLASWQSPATRCAVGVADLLHEGLGHPTRHLRVLGPQAPRSVDRAAPLDHLHLGARQLHQLRAARPDLLRAVVARRMPDDRLVGAALEVRVELLGLVRVHQELRRVEGGGRNLARRVGAEERRVLLFQHVRACGLGHDDRSAGIDRGQQRVDVALRGFAELLRITRVEPGHATAHLTLGKLAREPVVLEHGDCGLADRRAPGTRRGTSGTARPGRDRSAAAGTRNTAGTTPEPLGEAHAIERGQQPVAGDAGDLLHHDAGRAELRGCVHDRRERGCDLALLVGAGQESCRLRNITRIAAGRSATAT